MKKYIRELFADLRKQREPQNPKPKTIDLDVPPPPPAPEDLNNQILSKNPEQRVRQLDYQAQEDEERETLE